MGDTTKTCEKIVQTNDDIHIHDSPEKIFGLKPKIFIVLFYRWTEDSFSIVTLLKEIANYL